MPRQQSSASQDYQGSGENFLRKVDYDAKSAEFNDRLKALEDKIRDNDSFAVTFNEAFENSKKLDATILSEVVTLIETNDSVKRAIKTSVNEADRDWQKAAMKRVGFAVWTLVVALISGAIVFFVRSN